MSKKIIIVIVGIGMLVFLFLRQDLDPETGQDQHIEIHEKILLQEKEVQPPMGVKEIVQIKQKEEDIKLKPHHLYVASEDEIRQSFTAHEKMEERVLEQRKREDAHRQKQKFIKIMKQIQKEKEENE